MGRLPASWDANNAKIWPDPLQTDTPMAGFKRTSELLIEEHHTLRIVNNDCRKLDVDPSELEKLKSPLRLELCDVRLSCGQAEGLLLGRVEELILDNSWIAWLPPPTRQEDEDEHEVAAWLRTGLRRLVINNDCCCIPIPLCDVVKGLDALREVEFDAISINDIITIASRPGPIELIRVTKKVTVWLLDHIKFVDLKPRVGPLLDLQCDIGIDVMAALVRSGRFSAIHVHKELP